MQPNKQRCPRCSGAKKVYKVANGYSLANFGGTQVTCPFCNGEGVVSKLEDAVEEITKKNKKEEKSTKPEI